MRDKAPKHGRIKEKYNPKPNTAERRYHDWARGFGCLVCKRPASIHHVISDGFKRVSKNHWMINPLCPKHHQEKGGYHDLGHRKFEKKYGIHSYNSGIVLLEEYQQKGK